MRPPALCRTVAVLVAAALLALASPALAQSGPPPPGGYRPPVDAPVTDSFRPPPEPWAAGNRGLEYATTPGQPVRAAAAGEVVFAGLVAGSLHVVVLHPDGVRTSYSFLQSIAVHRGDRVEQGRVVGAAGERLHFGARIGDVYIDPARLFDAGPPEVFLVPDEVKRPASEEEEREGVLDTIIGLGGDLLGATKDGLEWAASTAVDGLEWSGNATIDAAEWWADVHTALASKASTWLKNQIDAGVVQAQALVHFVRETNPTILGARVLRTVWRWWKQRGDCTPDSVPTPKPGAGHVAVLVPGLGSTSGDAGIDDVKTLALGYHPADVVRFSYTGGTVAEHRYTSFDTTQDIRESARELRRLLVRVAAEHPGSPIDLLAHSQGGLVARAAVAYEADPGSPPVPRVSSLVTLATPHHGTVLATTAMVLQTTRAGEALEDLANGIGLPPWDVKGTSIHQMSEISTFVREINDRPLPPGMRATSIGARGDLVVPAGHAQLPDAHYVVVSPDGPLLSQHTTLPGSSAAQREIALGVAGLPPSCQSLSDMLVDTAVSETISFAEDSIAGSISIQATRAGPSSDQPDDPGAD